MKVIAIGDPHFRTDNIPEVNLFLDKIEELAKKENPNFIVVLGDVLHTHERLHTIPLNKAYEFIERLRNVAKTFVLVGNHDMCFSKNTPILLWDGNVKNSQEIKVGDILVGDDNTPRKVINTKYGHTKMYTVKQKNGMNYTVTENHILCLKNPYKICDYMADIDMSVKEYLSIHENIRKNLYGYRKELDKIMLTEIEIVESDEREFFGWETDGNHKFLLTDSTVVHNCNNQQFLSQNHWMNGMKEWDNVEIVDTTICRKVDNYNFVFCPYVPPGRFQEALDTDKTIDWKKADCIFSHQEFYGCKMGAIVSVDGDKWPENFPNIVSGHIHSRQIIQDNVYYCGSSMQNAFGESEKNVIPILTWSKPGQKYSLNEVDLLLPRKKIIYTDVQSMEDYEQPETEDKIKITISGVYDEFKAFKKTKKYRELVKKGTKIVFKPKKIKKSDKEDDDEKEEKTTAEPVDETDFNRILSSLINKEKSSYLYQVFELVINNKTVEEDDILFL